MTTAQDLDFSPNQILRGQQSNELGKIDLLHLEAQQASSLVDSRG
jgi:hypothetical protein